MVKSSMHSRPKFSLLIPTELVMPSRKISIAGSFATAWSRSAKLVVAYLRTVTCCWRNR